jgi:hypothetical protein
LGPAAPKRALFGPLARAPSGGRRACGRLYPPPPRCGRSARGGRKKGVEKGAFWRKRAPHTLRHPPEHLAAGGGLAGAFTQRPCPRNEMGRFLAPSARAPSGGRRALIVSTVSLLQRKSESVPAFRRWAF